MELKEIYDILKKNLLALIAFAAIFASLVCSYFYYQSLFYEGVFIFSVQRTDVAPEGAGANLDGYYLIESARLFGRRLGNFLALKSGDFEVPFAIKQLNDYDYKISIKAKTESEISEAAAALESAVAGDLENSSLETGEYAAYSVSVSEIKISKIRPDYFFLALIAAIGGLLAGVFAVLFRNYLSEQFEVK